MTPPPSTHACRVCGGRECSDWLHPREMMFGLRESFAYFRCADCGCLQIDQAPAALERFYPDNYYSYGSVADGPGSWVMDCKRKWLWSAMTRHKLGRRSPLGRLLSGIRPGPYFPEWLRFLDGPVSLHGAILDVGCGSGRALLALRDCGFTDLLGVDPFIPRSLFYRGGVRVVKGRLSEITGRFRVIMFHHVFEHLDEPLATLRQARQLLAPGGQMIVRVPVSDSFAAQEYRENWVSLDAPRHITLQTRRSMEIVAQKTDLKIIRVVHDSTEFQFIGSEQYARDIPLTDPRSYYADAKKSIFPEEKIRRFALESVRLNGEQRGDQAAFVLGLETPS